MNATARDLERVSELLADEAAGSIEPGTDDELAALLGTTPGVRRDAMLEAAGLVQVACLRREGAPSPMPAALRQKLIRQGETALLRQRGPVAVPAPAVRPKVSTPATAPSAGRPRLGAMLGWALAAVLALVFVVLRPDGPELPADLIASRAALLAEAGDAITLPWSPPTVAGYEQVKGDVVWSESRQQGYLRLAGLPVNDPSRAQYQLWIVDPERDTHPVDGGVFDVNSRGEVLIPIQAKLRVTNPKAFAITLEKPGGVVVSAGPLLVVASG
jgi:hypothetical protein